MSRQSYRRANPDLDPWFALVDRVEARPEPIEEESRMTDQVLVPGDLVDVEVRRAGGPVGPVVGKIRGVVMHAGIEVDVRLLLSDEDETFGQDPEEVDEILEDSRSDLSLGSLSEGTVYVLRNCQPEEVVIVPRGVLPAEVWKALRDETSLAWAGLCNEVDRRMG